jgi:hypothetical protein
MDDDNDEQSVPEGAFGDALPKRPDLTRTAVTASDAPDWAMPLARKVIWRVVVVILIVAALILAALQTRSLLSMLFIALVLRHRHGTGGEPPAHEARHAPGRRDRSGLPPLGNVPHPAYLS